MSEPSKWAIEAANDLLPHRAIMSSPEAMAEYRIQDAIDQACAQKDAEIARLKDDNGQYEATFNLQQTRLGKAAAAWRKAHPGKELVSPDLGDLLDWLLSERDARYNAGLLTAIEIVKETLPVGEEMAVLTAGMEMSMKATP
jgi:hypothetical protein